jgi:hypothetical protein
MTFKLPDCCGYPFDQTHGRRFTCQKCGVLYHFEGVYGPIIPWWSVVAVAVILIAAVFFLVNP